MSCENCKQEWACPCKACVDRKAGGDLPVWREVESEEYTMKYQCPNCKTVWDIHDLMDQEWARIKAGDSSSE